jgi:sn-glycerol 3-phosphate transport system ATP-binding protein
VVGAECAGGTLGVRPEHVELVVGRGFPAAVEGVEYLGADSLLTCRLGEATLTVRAAGAVGVAKGDAVGLAWAPGAQHVFDRDGRRIATSFEHRNATQYA